MDERTTVEDIRWHKSSCGGRRGWGVLIDVEEDGPAHGARDRAGRLALLDDDAVPARRVPDVGVYARLYRPLGTAARPGGACYHPRHLRLPLDHPRRRRDARPRPRDDRGNRRRRCHHMTEEPPTMTPATPAIAVPALLSTPGRRATRYARGMARDNEQQQDRDRDRDQDDPLYTVARFTTTQAADMLGIKRVTVHSAIQRGKLPSELASVGVRLVSQAAIDAYRAHHLGQVGKPSNKKQRMKRTAEAAKAAAADGASAAAVGTKDTRADDDDRPTVDA